MFLSGALLALGLLGAVAAPTPVPSGGAAAARLAGAADHRLALGQSHTCAIVGNGTVRCWGFNAGGQLGTGSTAAIGDDEPASAGAPVDLGPGVRARAIVAGDFHTCAIVGDGSVRCWGENRFGQLGYARTDDIGDDESPASAGPVNLGPGRTARALVAGSNFTCALLDDSSVRCWGANSSGQLGLASTENVGDDETPGSVGVVDLGAGRRAVALAAGGFHVCAVLEDGALLCWGGNGTGELGHGDVENIGDDETPGSHVPVFLGRDRTARAVVAGIATTCALLDNGSVRCWGYGGGGALGLGFDATIGDDESPATAATVRLGDGRRARALASGIYHVCALLDDGAVRCWGPNASGQLGYGNTATVGDAATPDQVAPADLGGRAVEIAAGGYHTCARLADGAVRCWGANDSGQLGLGNTRSLGDVGPPSAADPVRLR